MQMHKTQRFSIFFGDEATSFVPQEFYGCQDEAEIRNSPPFAQISKKLGIKLLGVVKQVHGTDGLLIKNEADVLGKPYAVAGDYLITSVPGIGLAIATADCLPIVLYDPVQHVAAAVHAGWRGSVAGIAPNVVANMQEQFTSKPEDVIVFFGPSAGVCCYEVDAQFIEALPEQSACVVIRDGRYYFDTKHYNQLALQRAGVQEFVTDYWRCTICSPGFCSYRRDGKASKRQMTIVALNSI